jgi:hypothetical protein
MLMDHKFGIAKAGFGTALPAVGSVIRGFLWEISPADEAALDRFEGIPEGLYTKTTFEVQTAEGRMTSAMAYRAADPRPGVPVPGYLERIVEVAASLGFPEAYLGALRSLFAPR